MKNELANTLATKAIKALEEIKQLSERVGNDRVLECLAYEAEGARKTLELIAKKSA